MFLFQEPFQVATGVEGFRWMELLKELFLTFETGAFLLSIF